MELETYQLIRNLVIPHKPANKSFKQLVDLVQAHYSPSHSVIVQRLAYNKRVQREGETAAEFVVELRILSEQCQFGASLNEMLRNQLVCGAKDGSLQRRLLAEPDLTFRKAFELCQASELAEKNAKELQAGQKQSQMMAGASVMVLRSEVGDRKPASGLKCYRCNSTQHLVRDCRFKAAVCHACGRTGHIARACHSKGNTQSRVRRGKKH